MGVTSRMDSSWEPMRMRGFQVGLEPAFITSWESGNLYAPPGLTLDDPVTPCPGADSLPFKVSISGLGSQKAVGTKLQKPAAFTPYGEHQRAHRRAKHQQQKGNPDMPQRQRRRCFLLIATHLRQLEDEDPRKLLVVRKINRLGFDSAEKLQDYFGQYGTVAKVLLSNKHDKQAGGPFPTRLRPSGIGYVLFETTEGAAQALAKGDVQLVQGVEICIRAFEKRQLPKEAANADDAEDCGNPESGGADFSSSSSEQAAKDD